MKLFSLSLITLLLAVSCKHVKPLATSDLPEVTIVNVGELMSTYKLQQDTAAVNAINKIAGLSSTDKENIYKYSNEANWPAGINSLVKRAQNAETIKTYRAFKLASFAHASKGTMYILKIPMTENAGMTGDFALSNDIYFVMSAGGFQLK